MIKKKDYGSWIVGFQKYWKYWKGGEGKRQKCKEDQRKQLLQKKGMDFGNGKNVGEGELINERNLYGI